MRDNPITTQDVPALAPLRASHEATQLEAELKALFMALFEQFVRPAHTGTSMAGMPHIGPMPLVERAVKSEGLGLLRKGDEEAMRYMFRAWRARNPKRGLHLLRLYLQLFWPNNWTMYQMWSEVGTPYPTQLTIGDEGNHFLTSRIRVEISGSTTDGSDVSNVAPAMRSVLPARLLLNVAISTNTSVQLGMLPYFQPGLNVQHFTGEFERPDDALGVIAWAYAGSTLQIFSGSLV